MKSKIVIMSLLGLLLFLGHGFTFAQNTQTRKAAAWQQTHTRKPQQKRAVKPQTNCVKTQQSNSDETIYYIAEEMPSFKGNVNKWVAEHLVYPKEAATDGIQGRVIVNFVVEKDGSITDINVVRSIHPALDSEAIRVVKTMPKWNPGRNAGKPVRARFTLPVSFRLWDTNSMLLISK